MIDFEKQSYWQDRFSRESSFEWLTPSSTFIDILKPHLACLPSFSSPILHIGFGTSDLQNHLRAAGLTNVTNIDYAPSAIPRGEEAEKSAFGDVRMRYEVRDVLAMAETSSSPSVAGEDDDQADRGDREEKFDLIIDKGTADAVACGGEDGVRRMAGNVRASLRPGAAWITMSYSKFRFDMEGLGFDVEVADRVLTDKINPNDPDIYNYCYLLRPKE